MGDNRLGIVSTDNKDNDSWKLEYTTDTCCKIKSYSGKYIHVLNNEVTLQSNASVFQLILV